MDATEPKKPYVFRTDNPGGDWLRRKQQDAELALYGPTKGINGSTTAYMRSNPGESVCLPPGLLKNVPGRNGERRRPGDPQYDALLKHVLEHGWRNDSPILLKITHRGNAVIPEGNTRVAVALAIGQPGVPLEIHWMNGGEDAEGPWSPDRVLPLLKAEPTMSPIPEKEGARWASWSRPPQVAQAAEAGQPAPDPEENALPGARM